MTYAVSLLLGAVVGVAYALLRVTPPAPPVIALVGLLGMLAGENATTWARSRLAAHRPAVGRDGQAPQRTSAPVGARTKILAATQAANAGEGV